MSDENKPTETLDQEIALEPKPIREPDPIRERYRVRFQKTGLLRWISHRDLARLWERLVRRAQLVLSMTEGFHPKPRIAFPSALALGTRSLDEVVELELAERMTPQDLLERLIADNQPGLPIKSVVHLPAGFGKGQMKTSHYTIEPPTEFFTEQLDGTAVCEAIETLKSQSILSVKRKKKTHQFEVANEVIKLHWSGDAIEMALNAGGGASLKPSDLLDAMGLDQWIEKGAAITRTSMVLEKEFTETTPENFAQNPLHCPTNESADSLRIQASSDALTNT